MPDDVKLPEPSIVNAIDPVILPEKVSVEEVLLVKVGVPELLVNVPLAPVRLAIACPKPSKSKVPPEMTNEELLPSAFVAPLCKVPADNVVVPVKPLLLLPEMTSMPPAPFKTILPVPVKTPPKITEPAVCVTLMVLLALIVPAPFRIRLDEPSAAPSVTLLPVPTE